MEASSLSTQSDQGFRQHAAAVGGDARERVSGAVGSARARIGNLQAQLADAMDSSANVVRQRAAALAPAASAGESASAGMLEPASPQIAAQGELVAGVLERGAMWLRENDLGDLEARGAGSPA